MFCSLFLRIIENAALLELKRIAWNSTQPTMFNCMILIQLNGSLKFSLNILFRNNFSNYWVSLTFQTKRQLWNPGFTCQSIIHPTHPPFHAHSTSSRHENLLVRGRMANQMDAIGRLLADEYRFLREGEDLERFKIKSIIKSTSATKVHIQKAMKVHRTRR